MEGVSTNFTDHDLAQAPKTKDFHAEPLHAQRMFTCVIVLCSLEILNVLLVNTKVTVLRMLLSAGVVGGPGYFTLVKPCKQNGQCGSRLAHALRTYSIVSEGQSEYIAGADRNTSRQKHPAGEIAA